MIHENSEMVYSLIGIRRLEMMRMKVLNADIVDLWKQGEIVCITLSLEVRYKEMVGIIDRGNALAMGRIIPGLASLVGHCILQKRGEVAYITERLIAFYTKPAWDRFERGLPDEIHRYNWGHKIPGSHCIADPVIVARSARQLLRLVDREKPKRVYLPVPGVGDGALDVEDIQEALQVLEKEPRIILVSNRRIEGKGIQMIDSPL